MDDADLELFREELESYAPDLISTLDRLSSHPEAEDDWETVRRYFHTIKGAARTVGASRVADFAQEAENAAEEAIGNPDKRRARRAGAITTATRRMLIQMGVNPPEKEDATRMGTAPTAPPTPPEPGTFKPPPKPAAPLPDSPRDAIPIALRHLSTWESGDQEKAPHAFSNAITHCQTLLKHSGLPELATSFQHLREFIASVPADVHPLFHTVIRRALEDAQLFFQEWESNPQLSWNRKWSFYFSSLRIALASELDSGTAEPDIDPEMLETFLEEASAIIDQLETDLIQWEKGNQPGDRQAALRRHFHTLKGAANSTGLSNLGKQFHALEDYLDSLASSPPSPEIFSFLFQCLDQLRAERDRLEHEPGTPPSLHWVESVASLQSGAPVAGAMEPNADPVDPEMLEVFVEEAEALYDPIESAILAWEQGQPATEHQPVLRRHFHTLKGAANSVGLSGLGADFHALEDAMESLPSDPPPEALFSFLLRCLDDVRHHVTLLEKNPSAAWSGQWKEYLAAIQSGDATPAPAPDDTAPHTAPTPESPTLRVDARQLRNLMNLIAEMIADRQRFEDNIHTLYPLLREMEAAQESRRRTSPPDVLDPSLPLHDWEETLDTFLERFKEDSLLFTRQARQIQSELDEMNLGPVAGLFRRLSRSFRDACKEEGKEAEWSTEGESTQLDRTVLEHLYGPLLHVVRNAVAHGIESPDDRQSAGKPRSGMVHIAAHPQANQVVLEIRDDGAGINGEAVLKRGIARGLVPPETTSLSHDEVVALLFTPGFSTKEQVSSVAGRGVGLDVVKGEIEALNGSVGVHYEPGQGTSWKIRVPLSLTASEALLLRAGPQVIAIPLSYADHCIQIGADTVQWRSGRHHVEVGEESLPWINLAEALGLESTRPATHAVVVDSGMERAVLGVHELLKRREIVVKDMGPLLASFSIYSGVTADSDGSLIPILQVPTFLSHFLRDYGVQSRREDSQPPEPASPPPTESRSGSGSPTRILLADDSPSVRKMQNQELSRAGYDVTLVQNGQAALDLLEKESFDLLITDWEMPEVDGEALIRRLRNPDHPSLHQLPVIVISSRVDEAFDANARELGATFCLPKPFDVSVFEENLWRSGLVIRPGKELDAPDSNP